MGIKEVIAIINQMQADGVIERYPIGGAVGALDTARFQVILTRHGLLDAWHKFERQFLSDTP